MTPWLDDGDVRLYHGDNLDVLRTLPDKSVHMCATSPPFYGLRSYVADDHPDKALEIGLEETPDQWVANLVAVFREVRRVLRDDGTLWVEIGDSYMANQGAPTRRGDLDPNHTPNAWAGDTRESGRQKTPMRHPTKPKDLLGQPWLLAFALRADGWWLRSEIIWARPNPMPESVTDRPTKSHSTVFLLSKQPRYFYDADAIREQTAPGTLARFENGAPRKGRSGEGYGIRPGDAVAGNPFDAAAGANARSVWTIPTQPTPFAHFATWPEALVRRMILAGTSEKGCCPECGAPWVRRLGRPQYTQAGGVIPTAATYRPNDHNWDGAKPRLAKKTDTLGWSPSCESHGYDSEGFDLPGVPRHLAPVPCTVLDPFAGSATTMLVARNHGRHSIGIELNEQYLEIAAKRLQQLSLLA